MRKFEAASSNKQVFEYFTSLLALRYLKELIMSKAVTKMESEVFKFERKRNSELSDTEQIFNNKGTTGADYIRIGNYYQDRHYKR